MKIDKFNCKIINTREINLHDDVLETFQFDRIQRKITFNLSRILDGEHLRTLCFYDVIGFEISSCDFWGASECIYHFQYIEPNERVVIPNLIKKWQTKVKTVPNITYDDYIETLFIFSSGDEFRIACKEIEILQLD